jgi:glycerol-1-phosphate dehydrogenase [NAD(P)+]
MTQSWIEHNYPTVQIPALARIRRTRGEIADDIDNLFDLGVQRRDTSNGEMIRQPINNPCILAGPTTVHFANEILQYSKTIKDLEQRTLILEHKAENEGYIQGYWHGIQKIVDEVKGKNYDFIIYVGSQNIADTAKAVAADCKILTGGVITAMTGDGLFSDTASLNDKQGLSTSMSTVAPYFVLAHGPTLVRSPSEMKTACVADVLTNYSALWDHKYSTSHLNLPLSDIAEHFSQSAAALLNPLEKIDHLALSRESVIYNLFRATELCGISMQLNRGFDGKANSATCSGSEHNIEKEIRKLLVRHSLGLQIAGNNPPPVPLHGQILSPCLLLTLTLQGQTDLMVQIRDLFSTLGLPTTTAELGISNEDFITCVSNARCARSPARREFEAGNKSPAIDRRLDRLTVLENIESKALVSSVKSAMKLSKVG